MSGLSVGEGDSAVLSTAVSLHDDHSSHATALLASDAGTQLVAAEHFRRLLSAGRNKKPVVDSIVGLGIIPRMVTLLTAEGQEPLQLEAAWSLSCIASSDSGHANRVVEAGAVTVLLSLCESSSVKLREQVVWTVGNIVRHSVSARDAVLSAGGMESLSHAAALSVAGGDSSGIRRVMWSMAMLCAGSPPPHFDIIAIALPTIVTLVQLNDEETATDACWALAYLSDGPDDRIQRVLDSGVAPFLVRQLDSVTASLLVPALRTVGNIVTGDDRQTQAMIDLDVIPRLSTLLDHAKKNVRMETFRCIRILTAGSQECIQAVIDAAAGLLPSLVFRLQDDLFDTRKEAACALSSILSGGSEEQIHSVSMCRGMIPHYLNLLYCTEIQVLTMVLTGLDKMLDNSHRLGEERYMQVKNAVIEDNGVDKLTALTGHASLIVYQLTIRILRNHFGMPFEDVLECREDYSGSQGDVGPDIPWL